MAEKKTTETLLNELEVAQKTRFEKWDKDIAGLPTVKMMDDMKAEIMGDVRKLIPASMLAAIHRETTPERAKRQKMADAWSYIIDPSSAMKRLALGDSEATMKALGISVGANMGFGVPEEMLDEIAFLGRNYNFMEPLIRIINNAPEKFTLPRENAGFTFSRGKTGQVPTESTPTVDQLNYSLAELTGICYISNVLLRYSKFDVPGFLNEIAARDRSDQYLKDWWLGTGSNEPTGIRLASGVNSVGAMVGANLSGDDLDAILAAHPTKYLRGAAVVWIASKNVANWISRLKDGEGGYLFLNAREGRGKGLTNSGQPEQNLAGYIKGYAMYEHPNAVDTELWLVDLSRYWAPRSGGMEIAVSTEYRHAQNQTTIRLWSQDDGNMTVGAAATKLLGVAQ